MLRLTNLRRSVGLGLALILAFGGAPVWAAQAAAGSPAALEGLLLDADARPASGYGVVLLDREGNIEAEVAADEDGLYAFEGLAGGQYAMGIRTPEGTLAAVAVAPVTLGQGQLARRDLLVVPADESSVDRALVNYGLGTFWAGRTRNERIWIVIGVLAGVALIYSVVDDDDDDDEGQASPSSP